MRKFDIIKNEYKKAFIPPISACQQVIECKPNVLDEIIKCNEVLPSSDDHFKSLKIINFLRYLAGFPKDIIENDTWSHQCYNAAINIQKIGKIPSDHLINSEYAVEDYCGDDSNIQFTNSSKLLINDNSMNVFEFIKNVFTNEKIDDQVLFLHPNLKEIGFGFYPIKEEEVRGIEYLKPPITVIKLFDKKSLNSIEHQNFLSDLNFISWPPEGPFPIELLRMHWHIRHDVFKKTKLNDIKIIIQRDDGVELSIKNKSIQNDVLIIQLKKSDLKKCQLMKQITVTIINEKYRKIYRFSFKLFEANPYSYFKSTNNSTNKIQSSLNSNKTKFVEYQKSNENKSTNDEFNFIIIVTSFMTFFIIHVIYTIIGIKDKVGNEKDEEEEEEKNEKNNKNYVNNDGCCCYYNASPTNDTDLLCCYLCYFNHCDNICHNCCNCGCCECNCHNCCDCGCCECDFCDCDCNSCSGCDFADCDLGC